MRKATSSRDNVGERVGGLPHHQILNTVEQLGSRALIRLQQVTHDANRHTSPAALPTRYARSGNERGTDTLMCQNGLRYEDRSKLYPVADFFHTRSCGTVEYPSGGLLRVQRTWPSDLGICNPSIESTST
jgi:hypothetical protein